MAFPCCLHISLSPTVQRPFPAASFAFNGRLPELSPQSERLASRSFRVPRNLRQSIRGLRPGPKLRRPRRLRNARNALLNHHCFLKCLPPLFFGRFPAFRNGRLSRWCASARGSSHSACVCQTKEEMVQKQPYG